MGEPLSDRQHVDTSNAASADKKVSVMRKFLESGVDFEWPEGVGERSGSHCKLFNRIPLHWQKTISDKKASIDIYVGEPQYTFKEPFAVKTIREKDYLKSRKRAHIKPENILIDGSGSVVLTDFGISRRFPKKTPHITNDQWEWTRKYASPEIMKGRTTPRDDPSDVFSLGCVFLEMASLILGRDLDEMRNQYATIKDNSATDDAYHCNLDKVYTWIEHLRRSQNYGPRIVPDLIPVSEMINKQDFIPDPSTTMIEALDTVQQMLKIEPSERPPAKRLWEHFQQVSSQMCRDCDPRLPNDIWSPSSRQKNAVNEGTSRRRSMQQIPEEASNNPSMETREGQDGSSKVDDERLLSASYCPDQSGARGRRASSPYKGRRQSSSSKLLDPAPIPIPPYLYGSPGLITPSGEDSTEIERTLPEANSSKAMPHDKFVTTRSVSPRKRIAMSESHQQHISHAPGASGSAMHPGRASIVGSLPYAISVDRLPIAQNSMLQGDTNVSAPKQERVSSPPPASSLHGPPATLKPLGSSHSLAAKKQTTNSAPMNNQGKFNANRPSSHQKADHLQLDTQIIVYDHAKGKAYVTAYAQIEDKQCGKDYFTHPLPRRGQYIKIGEKGLPIATIDIGSLGFLTSVRRALGVFPTLYVLIDSFVQPPG
ncbi:MAG: hypothetical protein Q9182_007096 [Xanthomendoza sp. 2 TL-2023]